MFLTTIACFGAVITICNFEDIKIDEGGGEVTMHVTINSLGYVQYFVKIRDCLGDVIQSTQGDNRNTNNFKHSVRIPPRELYANSIRWKFRIMPIGSEEDTKYETIFTLEQDGKELFSTVPHYSGSTKEPKIVSGKVYLT